MTRVSRVAILGAESTGKSTLAAALARRYDTLWVPEYLREFVETAQRVPYETDQFDIARMQMEWENAAAVQASGFLFCDTTPFMTAIYSGVYWDRVDPALAALDRHYDYAVTLVAAPDLPWVADGLQRESEAVRQQVHQALVDKLDRRAIGFTLLTGSLEQRLAQAQAALEAS
ncbi:MAG: nicotinamide-nucleotide adenylyltransferase [Massilia sp.]|nr:nicotinamide-nucleotide adenylyltransferase [Massilia sp.]